MNINVGNYMIELDDDYVKRYEDATCGKITAFAETYARLKFKSRDIFEITKVHSKEEVKNAILEYMDADIFINE